MRALFVNVGQGDCTLVQHDGYSILCDAGTESAIGPRLSLLRAEAPRLDLIVGTHYDADHLTGLARVVDAYPLGSIGRAWLPPFLNPDGEIVDGSPFLADRIQRDGLGPALSPLEAFARRLPREELDGLRRALSRGRAGILEAIDNQSDDVEHAALAFDDSEVVPYRDEPSQHDDVHEGDAWEGFARPESGERVSEAIRIVGKLKLDALVELMNIGAKINELARAKPEIAASLLRSRSAIGVRAVAAMTATVAAVNGAHLEKLLVALHRRNVPWTIPIAPDNAGWVSFGAFEIAHLSPTAEFVETNRNRLPIIADAVYMARARLVDAELPSWSNRLSHALAIRPRGKCWSGCACGIALTGDCAFWRSVSKGAEEILASCGLIDVAHHGGEWGRFRELLVDAQTIAEPRSFLLWLSAKPDGWCPPGPRLARLVRKLGGRTRLLAANRPGARALAGLRELAGPETPPDAVELRACWCFHSCYHPWLTSTDGAFCWDVGEA